MKRNRRLHFTGYLLVLSLLLACNNKELKPAEKTVVEVFTPYWFFPETLNGKVKNLKETNYWAAEKDGKIVAGERISQADRDSLIDWTTDMDIQFDENGLITESTFLDENDVPTGHWMVESVDKRIVKGSWITNDTVRNYVIVNHPDHDDDFMIEMSRFHGQTDSLLSRSELQLNKANQKKMLRFFNASNELGREILFHYNENDLLTSYTMSLDDTVRVQMDFTINDKGFFDSQTVSTPLEQKTETYTYEYTYDDMGNWTSYIAYKDGTPEVVCERVYTYYP